MKISTNAVRDYENFPETHGLIGVDITDHQELERAIELEIDITVDDRGRVFNEADIWLADVEVR